MSTSTCTDLWLSPKDYKRKKVKAIIDDKFCFEFDDDDENKVDDEGMIRLSAIETNSFDELMELAKVGVSFQAREDSRCESEGSQCVFVAHRKRSVYMQEDGNGYPVVSVYKNGKVNKDDLAQARLFWKLRAKVVAQCLRNLGPLCADCKKPLGEAETMARNDGGLSHLEPCLPEVQP